MGESDGIVVKGLSFLDVGIGPNCVQEDVADGKMVRARPTRNVMSDCSGWRLAGRSMRPA